MHVNVKSLPECVQAALKSVNYHRADISVEPRESVMLSYPGGAGRKGFAILVNLTTGEYRTVWGSWGGANMFNPRNAVDLDSSRHTLPANGVAISGAIGHPRTYATIYCPPSMATAFLPAPTAELTDAERHALYCHRAIKGGEYRREEMRRRRVGPDVVDALVTRGLLKRNAAGAVAITTDGRNAVGDWPGY
jgi:hypothetical protein